MCVSRVCDREATSRDGTTVGKILSLLTSCVVEPYRVGVGAHIHPSIHRLCPGSWGRMCGSTQQLEAGICLAADVQTTEEEEAGGSFSTRTKGQGGRYFYQKGFSFLNDLIPKICRTQITTPEVWQTACRGEERRKRVETNCLSISLCLPFSEGQDTCSQRKS